LRLFFIIVIVWFATHTAWAAESIEIDTGKVNAQLVTSHDVIAPGQTFHVALKTRLDDHWHTYWRNPGDSGEPVNISWNLPDTLTPGEIIWPLPMPVPTGPIINYGFEGTPLFPVEMTVSEDAKPGTVAMIKADVYYLVCKDVCIPENTTLSVPLLVGEAEADDRWIGQIDVWIDASPVVDDVKGGVMLNGENVSFTFTDLPDNIDVADTYFFPFDQGLIDHSAPQNVHVGEEGILIETKAGFAWENGRPGPFNGVLKFGSDDSAMGTEVKVIPGEALGVGTFALAAPASPVGGVTLWTAIIGALIGGLILNLMPCVFPVISIKALSIAKTAHSDRAHVRREGWLYVAGVIATFLLLTAILLALKAGGAELGWGFQLQSPKLVAGLAILLFVIGLNLLGVFEFGMGLQDTGSELTQKDGWAGSFFTGALAVIVATPCTAPFMAGAIGYALAQPAIVTFVVFMALAIGFAAPFLLLSYAPGLLAKLPKPGPWMIRFREFLAFPMFAAAIWLVWVLSLQAGADGVLLVLLAMLAFGFAVWFFKRTNIVAKALGTLAILCTILLPLSISTSAQAVVDLAHETWSPERVNELRADGRTVFVDFTAAWCVTCKVNEKTVLERADVKDLFNTTDTAFVVADWTNKNDEIARELASHGRSGVPLYLVYAPGNNPVSPVILPQVLTKSVIQDAIEGATQS